MSQTACESRTKKVFLLSFGQLIASVSGFIIAVILSRLFSGRDYGTYRQVLLCFSMLLPVLSLGVPTALYYYLPNEERRPRGLIAENFILLGILGSIFILFIFLGGARFLSDKMNNPDLVGLLYLMAPYMVVKLIRSSVSPIFMSADKARFLAVFNAVSRLLECLFVIAAIVVFGSLVSVLAGTLIASVLVLATAFFFVLRTYELGPVLPSFAGIKRQLFYGAPLGLAAIFGSMIGYMDQLIVSMRVKPEDYAVYVNGAIKIPLMGIVVMSVTAVLLPDLSRMYKDGDRAGMLKIWQNAMVKSSYIIVPVTVFLMVLANDAILVAFSDKYKGSVGILRVFLVLLPFQMVSYGPIFHASNKNNYIVIINAVTLIFNIPLLFFSIHYFGIIGAAVATLFSRVCIYIFLHIFFISKIVGIPALEVMPISKLFDVMIPAIVLALPLMLRYIFGVSCFIALPVCALYYFPVCYLWLTRKCNAPRIVIVEMAFCFLNPHRRMS